jgi:alpha-L-arabinofuranosidase
MVNAIAPILTSKQGLVKQTTFYPMQLYRQQCGSRYVASFVESPKFSSKSFKNVPYLDASTTTDEARRQLSLAVVNRHESSPITGVIAVQGWNLPATGVAFEVNGPTPSAENTFATPNSVGIQRKPFNRAGEKFEYTFPAHSVTVLKFGA